MNWKNNGLFKIEGGKLFLFPSEHNRLTGAAWQEKLHARPEPGGAFEAFLHRSPTKGEANLTLLIMAVTIVSVFLLTSFA